MRLHGRVTIAPTFSQCLRHPCVVATAEASPSALEGVGAAVEGAFTALDNAGGTAVVFDNVNFKSKLLGMASLMGTSSLRLQQALLSLAKGLDEIFFIALYLVVVDRLIKLIWQLASRAQRLWLGQAAAEPVAESDFDSSLLGAMRKPLKRYGWGMLALWVIDALYVISAAFDPSLVARRRNLLVAASYVVYTYVSGQALSAVKNWWLERGMLARVVVPSRGQRAIARRASGILLWTLLILMCAEGLAKTTGIHLNSILSFAGVGGIAFGLATKDLLTNLVGGCLLFVSNPFVERDKITMTNLDESRVIRVGW